MERLWSPWRLQYITSGSGGAGCVFCAAAQPAPSTAHSAPSTAHGAPSTAHGAADDLVVARHPLAFVILNLYPYNTGHLMVGPPRHIASLAEATDDELTGIMRLVRDAEIALHDAYQPQGINVGINLGRPAGAGIVDHVHVHLVPRWTGDANFMSVIGETRVLPETLEQTAERLRAAFDKLKS